MATPKYSGTWQRYLWTLMDAMSVNGNSNDMSLSVVDDRTRKVRQGEVYYFSHIFSTISSGDSADILLKTGSERVTITTATAVGAESEIRIYEGVVITDDGTLLQPVVRNRNSSSTYSSEVYHTPTVSTLGTVLSESYFPAGVKNKEVGSSGEATAIWILKPNENYLFRVTNTSGGNEVVAISGDVFEDIV